MQYDSLSQLQALAAEGVTQGTILAQVTQVNHKTTRAGKPYLELGLGDVAASFSIKIWDNAPWMAAFRALEAGQAVAVTGVWQMSDYGMEASELEVRPLQPEEEEALLAGGEALRTRQATDWEEIGQLVESIRDPRLHALCRALLENFEGRFRRAGAARGYHHARRGGLVEHTAGVMRAVEALSRAYPSLNRELLLAGALFHDCGKMWENAYPEHSLSMPYSDAGELLGHISLGIEVINRLWARLMTEERRAAWESLQPPTEQVRLHLLHLVASHHGSLEFGSPVVPKTPEALALNHADDLDARLEMFRSAYETSVRLAPHIQQRKPPLPGNVVSSLPSFASTDA